MECSSELQPVRHRLQPVAGVHSHIVWSILCDDSKPFFLYHVAELCGNIISRNRVGVHVLVRTFNLIISHCFNLPRTSTRNALKFLTYVSSHCFAHLIFFYFALVLASIVITFVSE